MEVGELEAWGSCSADPLDVVFGEVVEPLVAVAGDDEGEEVVDCVVVVGVGKDEFAAPLGFWEGGEGGWD